MKQTLRCLALVVLPVVGWAQVPIITSVEPLANARATPRAGPLTVTLSQPLTTSSAGALQVFSSQRGGRRTAAAAAVVNAATLSFTPGPYAYQPGETVQYTVAQTAASAAGNLARPRVGQFITAVGGTGRGYFQPGSDPVVGSFPTSVVAGDVDNDGDLDFVAANSGGSTLSVRLNAGNGTFGTGREITVSASPSTLAIADVDGDGDLDLLVSYDGFSGAAANVLLNDGRGLFASNPAAVIARFYKAAMSDVDGDGDLDMVTIAIGSDSVQVSLNNGRGLFNKSQSVRVGDGPFDLAMGDVDNDGDLDVLTANDNTNTVSVCLNTGSGTFSRTQDVVVGQAPTHLAVGDVDGDGDLDFVVSTQNNSEIGVHLNTGNGTFSKGKTLAIGGVTSLTLADVDADSDLDLLVTDVDYAFSSSYNTVNVRLNAGNGVFGGGQDLLVGPSPRSIVAADVDGDGDLDLLTANYGTTVSVRLNGGTTLATAPGYATPRLALFPNPAHGAITLTGSLPLASLVVLDALGRTVLRSTADADGTAHLALPPALPRGVYLVRTGTAVARWVVE